MTEITRKEFASAVAAAVTSVHHLSREVERLIEDLRDALAQAPTPLTPIAGTLGKPSRNPGRVILRNEYGILFGEPISDEDEAEEEEEEPDETDEEDDGPSPRKGGAAEIAPDQPLLAVRIVVHEPQRQEDAEPRIEYAILGDWTLGSKGELKPGQRFRVQKYTLRRIPRALGTSHDGARGTRLYTKAVVKGDGGGKKSGERRISCRLRHAIESVPLYSMEDAKALHELAERMKTMWTTATTS